MNLVSVYTREQAIEDGVLVSLDHFFKSEQANMSLPERMQFSLRLGKLREQRAAKFSLGELVITANATATLDAMQSLELLVRHQAGDWGEVSKADKAANDAALLDGSRLFSVYELVCGHCIYVITEWNREATTIMRPVDY